MGNPAIAAVVETTVEVVVDSTAAPSTDKPAANPPATDSIPALNITIPQTPEPPSGETKNQPTDAPASTTSQDEITVTDQPSAPLEKTTAPVVATMPVIITEPATEPAAEKTTGAPIVLTSEPHDAIPDGTTPQDEIPTEPSTSDGYVDITDSPVVVTTAAVEPTTDAPAGTTSQDEIPSTNAPGTDPAEPETPPATEPATEPATDSLINLPTVTTSQDEIPTEPATETATPTVQPEAPVEPGTDASTIDDIDYPTDFTVDPVTAPSMDVSPITALPAIEGDLAISEEIIIPDAPDHKKTIRLGNYNSGRLFIMEFRDGETFNFGTVCRGVRSSKENGF